MMTDLQQKLLTAKQIQSSEIPVYVIPDKPGGQRPKASSPHDVKSWQSTLAQNMDAIQQHRKDNPIQSPYPQGTKTLAAQELEEGKRQFDETLAEDKRRHEQSLALKRATGTGITRQTAATAVLKGAITKYYELLKHGINESVDSRGQITHYGFDPDEAVQLTQQLIYQQLGEAGLGVKDADDIIKAFRSAINYSNAKEVPFKQQYEDAYYKQKLEEGTFLTPP